MKTIAIRIFSLASLLGLLLFSCKKYEDGPLISLRTKKARLANTWKVESITDNGTDVTADFLAAEGQDFRLIINKNETFSTTGTNPDSGTWELGEDKDDITFKTTHYLSTYRILRLKNKELWLRYTNVNGTYVIYKYVQA